MPHPGCEQCKIFLDAAAAAISAHAQALAKLSEAVGGDVEVGLAAMEKAVRSTRLECDLAVEKYEYHKSAHELKVMSAGSKMPD